MESVYVLTPTSVTTANVQRRNTARVLVPVKSPVAGAIPLALVVANVFVRRAGKSLTSKNVSPNLSLVHFRVYTS